jgi:hypothetical protein
MTDFAPCSCLEWRLALLLTPRRKAGSISTVSSIVALDAGAASPRGPSIGFGYSMIEW